MSPELAECIMKKGLGSPDHSVLNECILVSNTSKGSLTVNGLKTIGDCYARTQKVDAAKIIQMKTSIDCSNATKGSALQECLLKLQLPEAARNGYECVSAARDAIGRLECYLGQAGADAQKIKACTNERNRMQCLQTLLPAAAQQGLVYQKCTSASRASSYLDCAQALGVQVDPKLALAVECVANTSSWTGAAGCVAAQNLTGPAAYVATCFTESAAAGGASAVGACVVSNALGFNEDLQMLMQCGAATGGEPTSTATCTLGKFAMRELGNCRGQKFGDDKCFGENNTLRKALNIGPGSTVATIVNHGLDLVNGVMAFAENPSAAAEATVKNWANELTIARTNVYREVDKAAEDVRREVSNVTGPGVYVKVDARSFQVGDVKFSW